MEAGRQTRRVYSAEELHRLRNAYSLPKLEEAIEERDGEDAEIVKVCQLNLDLAFNQMAARMAEGVALNLKWIAELVVTPPDEEPSRILANAASPTEHVLRGSKSFAARSFRSRAHTQRLRIPSATSNNENAPLSLQATDHPISTRELRSTDGVLGEIAANSQGLRPGMYKFGPSPTPSIKKKKAEAIVKAHGSPTHVRVTAGGRIVPSEQSPLCHPRYGYSAVKVNGGLIKFAPNYQSGKAQWTRATENGFVAQDVHGNLCQIVNGTVLPLNQVNGVLRLYVPAPNLKVTQRGSIHTPAETVQTGSQPPIDPEVEAIVPIEPSLPSQISALELEYSKLEHDLKDVDKTEVIHGRNMSKMAKDALVSRRRELVISMDKVRKALKALNDQPTPSSPASPRAMGNAHTGQLLMEQPPTFLPSQSSNEAMNMPYGQSPYGSYVDSSLGPYFSAPFGFQPLPAIGDHFTAQPWGYANPGMFVPPSYDGPSATFPPSFQEPDLDPAFQQMRISDSTNNGPAVPQNDGSGSHEIHLHSPGRSHAVPIKAPDQPATGQKSNLNPMSPAYKPAASKTQSADRVPKRSSTSPHSAHSSGASVIPPPTGSRQRQASSQEVVGSNVSPTNRSTYLQSSSISSFETSDFFPRNTFEYSTRPRSFSGRYEYSDKENKDPGFSDLTHAPRPTTPRQGEAHDGWSFAANHNTSKTRTPRLDAQQPPAPPPGTPVHMDDRISKSAASVAIDQAVWDRKSKVMEHHVMLDRAAHNVSPKTKRRILSADNRPQETANAMSASREHASSSHYMHRRGDSPTALIDFTRKPRAWIEGYQAGLRRQPVGGDRYGEFLDGYCEGLLKSQLALRSSPHSEDLTGSPTKPAARLASPSARPWRSIRPEEHVQSMVHHDKSNAGPGPIESFKQAMTASQNENAILSPAMDDPHVNDYPFSLGAWAKEHGSRPQAHYRQGSLSRPDAGTDLTGSTLITLDERRVTSEGGVPHSASRALVSSNPVRESYGHGEQVRALRPPEQLKARMAPAGSPPASESARPPANTPDYGDLHYGGMTSVDPNLYRPWSGQRIWNPNLDIKSSSSISRAASVATGYFAHAQFDGAAHQNRITSAASPSRVPIHNARDEDRSHTRVMSSPVSSQLAVSPTLSAERTPVRGTPKKKIGSQSKSPSPAKSTFDNLAEKVGIKVSPSTKGNPSLDSAAAAERASPTGKRRWRDVWRGARKDEQH